MKSRPPLFPHVVNYVGGLPPAAVAVVHRAEARCRVVVQAGVEFGLGAGFSDGTWVAVDGAFPEIGGISWAIDHALAHALAGTAY